MGYKFKVGDLIKIDSIIRRPYEPRQRFKGMRRPTGLTGNVHYRAPRHNTGQKEQEKKHTNQFGIVTEIFHYNVFWRGTAPGQKDTVYITYMQEYGEYYILCEDEISYADEWLNEQEQ